VGNLINLRFENNSTFDVGPQDAYLNVFNIIPVYPSNPSDEWNWIHRAIVPAIYIDDRGDGRGSKLGLGDIIYQGYLSPAKPGKVICGVGPAVLIPTASKDRLGSELKSRILERIGS